MGTVTATAVVGIDVSKGTLDACLMRTRMWTSSRVYRRSFPFLRSGAGSRYLRYAGGARGFAAWLLVADALCLRRVGVSIFDLSDWSWRDAYDTGEPPGAAVREALRADDTYALLLSPGTG